MDIAILVLQIVIIVMVGFLFLRTEGLKKQQSSDEGKKQLEQLQKDIASGQKELRQEVTESVQGSMRTLGELLSANQGDAARNQAEKLADMDRNTLQKLTDMDRNIIQKQEVMNKSVETQLKQFEERIKTLETTNEQKLEAMRETIKKRLNYLQEDNNQKLEQIRITVDEKMQKTLEEKMNQSFKLVSERLEDVYKGLGEMQTLAAGVGDLKKVLSNVKTRGILGEIQLGAILQEILTSDQYDTDIAVVPGSGNRVEFAVKLPGGEQGKPVYLPIDSKFPGDAYAALQEAYDTGSADAVKAAYSNLEKAIKKAAKDIKDKYIAVPHTTNFAIMFLPFEGLYAEVVNRGLVEVLQREYDINIAGPSTMAALLNSLQMGFKTLQIQKRSDEVWKVLGGVKTEFANFEKVLTSAQKRIKQLDDDLDKLVGVRTRSINRKLRDVEQLDIEETEETVDLLD